MCRGLDTLCRMLAPTIFLPISIIFDCLIGRPTFHVPPFMTHLMPVLPRSSEEGGICPTNSTLLNVSRITQK